VISLFFYLLIGQKQQTEREKERERISTSMRNKIVKKLSQNSCTNIVYLSITKTLKRENNNGCSDEVYLHGWNRIVEFKNKI